MNMKSVLIISSLLLAMNIQAASSYKNYQYDNYVSVSHLHYVFNKVKESSTVSQKALARAFDYYKTHRYSKKLSPNFLAIADYTKSGFEKRLFIIDLHKGTCKRYLVAHGRKSGVRGGRVWHASNRAGSHKTPTGFFKIGSKEGITTRKKYNYLPLDGLEYKNRNAKKRQIILHTAAYVDGAGRSKGCFAIAPEAREQVFSQMKQALLFSYTGGD